MLRKLNLKSANFKLKSLYSKKSKLLYNTNRLQFSNSRSNDIHMQTKKQQESFIPVKGIPEFSQNNLFTVFEYNSEKNNSSSNRQYQKLPQVPYEVKEHALKGFIYTLFLTWGGRFIGAFKLSASSLWGYSIYPFIPFSVFTYHFLKPMWMMLNAVTTIKLKNDGNKVIFEFKNGLRPNLEVEISRISVKGNLTFFNECYSEPFLFPIELNYTDIYSQFSLRSKQIVYLHGDSHFCIKHGEILRAILNSQTIDLKA